MIFAAAAKLCPPGSHFGPQALRQRANDDRFRSARIGCTELPRKKVFLFCLGAGRWSGVVLFSGELDGWSPGTSIFRICATN